MEVPVRGCGQPFPQDVGGPSTVGANGAACVSAAGVQAQPALTILPPAARSPPDACSFCNRPPKSSLGQGPMARYDPTPSFNPFKKIPRGKPATAVVCEPEVKKVKHSTTVNRESVQSSRHNGLDGHLSLVENELFEVGLNEDLTLNHLFEETGHTWAHHCCAAWSEGVIQAEDYSLHYVDKAVVVGFSKKCHFCQRSGATINCRAVKCTRKFHYPCASAGGCFLDIKTLTLLCPEHAYQAEEKAGMEAQCVVCEDVGNVLGQLFCTSCGQHYHGHCLDPQIDTNCVVRAGWQCPDCKICQNCRKPGDDNKMLVCDVCDKGYHTYCLSPVVTEIPKNGWKCQKCRVCQDCWVKPGPTSMSEKWHFNFTVCDRCQQQRALGNCCPVCHRAHTRACPVLFCDDCKKGIHQECASKGRMSASGSAEKGYVCSTCSGLKEFDCPAAISDRMDEDVSASTALSEGSMHEPENKHAVAATGVDSVVRTSKDGHWHEGLTAADGADNPKYPVTHKGKGLSSASDKSTSVNTFASKKPPAGKKGAGMSPRVVARGKVFKKRQRNGGSTSDRRKNRTKARYTAPYGQDSSGSVSASNGPHPSVGCTPVTAASVPGRVDAGSCSVSRLHHSQSSATTAGSAAGGGASNSDDDHHSSVVLTSYNDDFVLNQDMCVSCGSFGKGSEGALIVCTQCGQCYHPYCVQVKLTAVMLEKGWRCLDCTVCEGCGNQHDEARLLLCDDCDISYHTYCLDPPLCQVPNGSWKCKWCVHCTVCGSRTPGFGCEWQNNYTECGPCSSLLLCPVCSASYKEEDLVIQCAHCERWLHSSCDGVSGEDDVEQVADAGYHCLYCRPVTGSPEPSAVLAAAKAMLLQQQAAAAQEASAAAAAAAAIGSSDNGKSVASAVGPPPAGSPKPIPEENRTYIVDGVCLSEAGMNQLKSIVLVPPGTGSSVAGGAGSSKNRNRSKKVRQTHPHMAQLLSKEPLVASYTAGGSSGVVGAAVGVDSKAAPAASPAVIAKMEEGDGDCNGNSAGVVPPTPACINSTSMEVEASHCVSSGDTVPVASGSSGTSGNAGATATPAAPLPGDEPAYSPLTAEAMAILEAEEKKKDKVPHRPKASAGSSVANIGVGGFVARPPRIRPPPQPKVAPVLVPTADAALPSSSNGMAAGSETTATDGSVVRDSIDTAVPKPKPRSRKSRQKSHIEDTYPPYLQEAFFGKSLLDKSKSGEDRGAGATAAPSSEAADGSSSPAVASFVGASATVVGSTIDITEQISTACRTVLTPPNMADSSTPTSAGPPNAPVTLPTSASENSGEPLVSAVTTLPNVIKDPNSAVPPVDDVQNIDGDDLKDILPGDILPGDLHEDDLFKMLGAEDLEQAENQDADADLSTKAGMEPLDVVEHMLKDEIDTKNLEDFLKGILAPATQSEQHHRPLQKQVQQQKQQHEQQLILRSLQLNQESRVDPVTAAVVPPMQVPAVGIPAGSTAAAAITAGAVASGRPTVAAVAVAATTNSLLLPSAISHLDPGGQFSQSQPLLPHVPPAATTSAGGLLPPTPTEGYAPVPAYLKAEQQPKAGFAESQPEAYQGSAAASALAMSSWQGPAASASPAPGNASAAAAHLVPAAMSDVSQGDDIEGMSYNKRSMLKWKEDEELGLDATISPVLYVNTNYADLKTQYPDWTERGKQITKLWRKVSSEEKAPYLAKARENRSKSKQTKAAQSKVSSDGKKQRRGKEGGCESPAAAGVPLSATVLVDHADEAFTARSHGGGSSTGPVSAEAGLNSSTVASITGSGAAFRPPDSAPGVELTPGPVTQMSAGHGQTTAVAVPLPTGGSTGHISVSPTQREPSSHAPNAGDDMLSLVASTNSDHSLEEASMPNPAAVESPLLPPASIDSAGMGNVPRPPDEAGKQQLRELLANKRQQKIVEQPSTSAPAGAVLTTAIGGSSSVLGGSWPHSAPAAAADIPPTVGVPRGIPLSPVQPPPMPYPRASHGPAAACMRIGPADFSSQRPMAPVRGPPPGVVQPVGNAGDGVRYPLNPYGTSGPVKPEGPGLLPPPAGWSANPMPRPPPRYVGPMMLPPRPSSGPAQFSSQHMGQRMFPMSPYMGSPGMPAMGEGMGSSVPDHGTAGGPGMLDSSRFERSRLGLQGSAGPWQENTFPRAATPVMPDDVSCATGANPRPPHPGMVLLQQQQLRSSVVYMNKPATVDMSAPNVRASASLSSTMSVNNPCEEFDKQDESDQLDDLLTPDGKFDLIQYADTGLDGTLAEEHDKNMFDEHLGLNKEGRDTTLDVTAGRALSPQPIVAQRSIGAAASSVPSSSGDVAGSNAADHPGQLQASSSFPTGLAGRKEGGSSPATVKLEPDDRIAAGAGVQQSRSAHGSPAAAAGASANSVERLHSRGMPPLIGPAATPPRGGTPLPLPPSSPRAGGSSAPLRSTGSSDALETSALTRNPGSMPHSPVLPLSGPPSPWQPGGSRSPRATPGPVGVAPARSSSATSSPSGSVLAPTGPGAVGGFQQQHPAPPSHGPSAMMVPGHQVPQQTPHLLQQPNLPPPRMAMMGPGSAMPQLSLQQQHRPLVMANGMQMVNVHQQMQMQQYQHQQQQHQMMQQHHGMAMGATSPMSHPEGMQMTSNYQQQHQMRMRAVPMMMPGGYNPMPGAGARVHTGMPGVQPGTDTGMVLAYQCPPPALQHDSSGQSSWPAAGNSPSTAGPAMSQQQPSAPPNLLQDLLEEEKRQQQQLKLQHEQQQHIQGIARKADGSLLSDSEYEKLKAEIVADNAGTAAVAAGAFAIPSAMAPPAMPHGIQPDLTRFSRPGVIENWRSQPPPAVEGSMTPGPIYPQQPPPPYPGTERIGPTVALQAQQPAMQPPFGFMSPFAGPRLVMADSKDDPQMHMAASLSHHPQQQQMMMQQQRQYEDWLRHNNHVLCDKVHAVEKRVAALKKIKKSLTNKQKQLKKNNEDLSLDDAQKLEQAIVECGVQQKDLDRLRKEHKQHQLVVQDYQHKQERLGFTPAPPMMATGPGMPAAAGSASAGMPSAAGVAGLPAGTPNAGGGCMPPPPSATPSPHGPPGVMPMAGAGGNSSSHTAHAQRMRMPQAARREYDLYMQQRLQMQQQQRQLHQMQGLLPPRQPLFVGDENNPFSDTYHQRERLEKMRQFEEKQRLLTAQDGQDADGGAGAPPPPPPLPPPKAGGLSCTASATAPSSPAASCGAAASADAQGATGSSGMHTAAAAASSAPPVPPATAASTAPKMVARDQEVTAAAVAEDSASGPPETASADKKKAKKPKKKPAEQHQPQQLHGGLVAPRLSLDGVHTTPQLHERGGAPMSFTGQLLYPGPKPISTPSPFKSGVSNMEQKPAVGQLPANVPATLGSAMYPPPAQLATVKPPANLQALSISAGSSTLAQQQLQQVVLPQGSSSESSPSVTPSASLSSTATDAAPTVVTSTDGNGTEHCQTTEARAIVVAVPPRPSAGPDAAAAESTMVSQKSDRTGPQTHQPANVLLKTLLCKPQQQGGTMPGTAAEQDRTSVTEQRRPTVGDQQPMEVKAGEQPKTPLPTDAIGDSASPAERPPSAQQALGAQPSAGSSGGAPAGSQPAQAASAAGTAASKKAPKRQPSTAGSATGEGASAKKRNRKGKTTQAADPSALVEQVMAGLRNLHSVSLQEPAVRATTTSLVCARQLLMLPSVGSRQPQPSAAGVPRPGGVVPGQAAPHSAAAATPPPPHPAAGPGGCVPAPANVFGTTCMLKGDYGMASHDVAFDRYRYQPYSNIAIPRTSVSAVTCAAAVASAAGAATVHGAQPCDGSSRPAQAPAADAPRKGPGKGNSRLGSIGGDECCYDLNRLRQQVIPAPPELRRAMVLPTPPLIGPRLDVQSRLSASPDTVLSSSSPECDESAVVGRFAGCDEQQLPYLRLIRADAKVEEEEAQRSCRASPALPLLAPVAVRRPASSVLIATTTTQMPSHNTTHRQQLPHSDDSNPCIPYPSSAVPVPVTVSADRDHRAAISAYPSAAVTTLPAAASSSSSFLPAASAYSRVVVASPGTQPTSLFADSRSSSSVTSAPTSVQSAPVPMQSGGMAGDHPAYLPFPGRPGPQLASLPPPPPPYGHVQALRRASSTTALADPSTPTSAASTAVAPEQDGLKATAAGIKSSLQSAMRQSPSQQVSFTLTLSSTAAQDIPGVLSALADLLRMAVPTAYTVSRSPSPLQSGSISRAYPPTAGKEVGLQPLISIDKSPCDSFAVKQRVCSNCSTLFGGRGDASEPSPDAFGVKPVAQKSVSDVTAGCAPSTAPDKDQEIVFCSPGCRSQWALASRQMVQPICQPDVSLGVSSNKKSADLCPQDLKLSPEILTLPVAVATMTSASPPPAPGAALVAARPAPPTQKPSSEPAAPPPPPTTTHKSRGGSLAGRSHSDKHRRRRLSSEHVAQAAARQAPPPPKKWKGRRWRHWDCKFVLQMQRPSAVGKDGSGLEPGQSYAGLYANGTPPVTGSMSASMMTLLNELRIIVKPDPVPDDRRQCLLCHKVGDGESHGPARLLNYDADKWIHLNCALWSSEVYETLNGALMNVEVAVKRGTSLDCVVCRQRGATMSCFKQRCPNIYHIGCALLKGCMFFQDKTMLCPVHMPREHDEELKTIAVYRKVYINRNEAQQLANVVHELDDERSYKVRLGALVFHSVGQLFIHQISTGNFHSRDHIYPVGYRATRYYWSMRCLRRRARYECCIGECDGRPEFSITIHEAGFEDLVLRDSSAQGVWTHVLEKVEKLCREGGLVKIFPVFLTGELLFGLAEPCIVRVIESLPGAELLAGYAFKFGRTQLIEMPLAINPTGCARSEPKLRTHFRRPHTVQTSSRSHSLPSTVTGFIGDVNSPYMKQFVHSKSQQYRRLKTEWRNYVYLGRSRIQGLGLFAARDIEKHTMMIEYIGEIIRNELAELREKTYEKQNRGVYMFRITPDLVCDATMAGGPARYVNHSCAPNCVAEIVNLEKECKIIIIANRRLAKGEELTYDYKFDFEDDQHKIPCNCGAANCRKWMN